MNVVTNFIGELVRDANCIQYLDAYQKRQMLERAVVAIRDMREEIGIPSGPGRDAVNDIYATAISIETNSSDESKVQQAMLTAAAILRDLHIVLDSGTKVTLQA